MVLDGAGDRELRGDLAVGQPPRDEDGDFALAAGERFDEPSSAGGCSAEGTRVGSFWSSSPRGRTR